MVANLVNSAMGTSSAAANTPKPASSLGFNLAGIAVLVLLLAVGAAYVIDDRGRAARIAQPDPADQRIVMLTLSGKDLSIPASWFRYDEQMRPGFSRQVDLQVRLGQDGGTPLSVDVTLLPRSRARPSSALLDAVYLHQFNGETLAGVPGLVGKPLQQANGFAGETVWYDALAADPFVAKCMASIQAEAPARCLRTVYLSSGIAAVYAFDATALPGWRSFDIEMKNWLEPIGAW
ncbi:hypothetical protein VW29_12405 [Devosia limi DSM 17137]|uniref:Uncharacterized protein n=1 Tax=Devosia limi DSM 17137 TaxID=1121477 RepID=A0A0F5LQX1_9HYPH|nr:hypothetical protein VW29_12405 [Devosia limi DSM 17137]